MRRVKKYKKYSNIREMSPYIPARISKFQRPKWKFFQKKLELRRTINKGEIISLGSITPLLWINKPCTIKAKIDELGECSINFTKQNIIK